MPFCHQSSFIRMPMPKYDVTYTIAADYAFFYNLYYKYGGDSFKKVSFPISVFEDEQGISSIQVLKTFEETLKIREQNKDICWYIDKFKLEIKKWLV